MAGGPQLTRCWLAGALCLAGTLAQAAPASQPWPRWQAHDEANPHSVDSGDWDALLAAYRGVGADGIARFAYGRVAAADRTRLAAYLARLQATPVSRLRRDEQRAFWINLYNAATVKVVLDHYPVERILDIDGGWLARGPWRVRRLQVEGEKLALDDIEHRILRPIWRDPRTHYALNCASLGCPDLAAHAWRAATLERDLDEAARAYVNHPRGARIDAGGLQVSSLYVWFQDDFGGSDAAVIEHLRRYAAPPLRAALARVDHIAGHAYDWTLNDLK